MYEITVETVPEQLIVASRRRTGYGRVSSEIRPLLDGRMSDPLTAVIGRT